MKVVSIAAGCVGLVGVMCETTTLAADVPSSFIHQEAARADASLRQRAEAPMARAVLPRQLPVPTARSSLLPRSKSRG